MKKLLLITLFALSFMANAQTITIGEGSEMTTQVPFNSFYNYSFTEQLFHADEIEFAGKIKAVSFRIAYSYNSEHTSDIVVYMKNVSRSAFADASDYESVTVDDMVFSGSWTIPADYDGWITINFDTPFTYNGSDNLLVAIDENSDDFAIRYFKYSNMVGSVLSYSSDNENPDPYNLGSFAGIKEVSDQRANIKLVFGTFDDVAEHSEIELLAYPNPANDIIYIDGVDGETVNVYDDLGRCVMKEKYIGRLNIGGLESGVYTVTIGNSVAKFVKK